MKKAISTLAMLTLVAMASAFPVGQQQTARLARAHWLAMGGKPDATLIATPQHWPYSHLQLYVAPQGGFVITATDDVARPILAYSLTATLTPDSISPALAAWLQAYNDEIAYAIDLGLPSSPDWLEASPLKSSSFTAMPPLCSTKWDQGSPYNAYTPSHTPVGCAATAQAQVMKYWNFPAFGRLSTSYDCPNFGPQSADFGHTLYQYELMPNQPFGVSAAQRHALSTLLYHVGVSLEMQYSYQGSGTLGFAGYSGTVSNDNSLQDYFFYKNTLEVKNKQDYTNDEWRDMLIEELTHRRPILYMGTDPQVGGHCFVCDGNDTLGHLHFNFGWSGDGDGYYAIGAIWPGIGSQGQSGNYSFNDNNMAIIKLEPDYAMRVSDTILSLGGDAGVDSLLFATNDTVDAPWTVSLDAPWATLADTTFAHAGWVRLHFDANTADTMRTAIATFTQANATLLVRLIQAPQNASADCPLTIVMESTRGSGWQGGAYLSIESTEGYIYGTATLQQGTSGTAQINVPDQPVVAVWHSGGGTDRNIKYHILDPNGTTILDVPYAFNSGSPHTLPYPCGNNGIDDPTSTDNAQIHIHTLGQTIIVEGADNMAATLYTVDGRLLSTTAHLAHRQALGVDATGVYILRLGDMPARKIVVMP